MITRPFWYHLRVQAYEDGISVTALDDRVSSPALPAQRRRRESSPRVADRDLRHLARR